MTEFDIPEEFQINEAMSFEGSIVDSEGKEHYAKIVQLMYFKDRHPYHKWYVNGAEFTTLNSEVKEVRVVIGASIYRLEAHERNRHGVLVYIGEDAYG
jgi:hypothetical protein